MKNYDSFICYYFRYLRAGILVQYKPWQEFIKIMLRKNPALRPTAQGVTEKLQQLLQNQVSHKFNELKQSNPTTYKTVFIS